MYSPAPIRKQTRSKASIYSSHTLGYIDGFNVLLGFFHFLPINSLVNLLFGVLRLEAEQKFGIFLFHNQECCFLIGEDFVWHYKEFATCNLIGR